MSGRSVGDYSIIGVIVAIGGIMLYVHTPRVALLDCELRIDFQTDTRWQPFCTRIGSRSRGESTMRRHRT